MSKRRGQGENESVHETKKGLAYFKPEINIIS